MRLRHSLQSCRSTAQHLIILMPLLLVACSTASTATAPNKEAKKEAKDKPDFKQNSTTLPRAGSGRGGYYQDDGPGDQPPENLLSVADAEPKIEPTLPRSNRPYAVLGKSYVPLVDNKPFRQRGIGSWYGKKFHGQKTSSGELYDMYKMTAAHPTLPIPSYARVTNIKNGRQVIVRINDRGPFHSSRVIDLSYTAALKLDYLRSGSIELEVERLMPDEIAQMAKEKQSALNSMVPASATMPSTPESSTSPDSTSPDAIEAMLLSDAGKLAVTTEHPQPALAVGTPQSTEKNVAVPTDPATSNTQAILPGSFYIQLGAYAKSDRANVIRTQYQQQLAGKLPSFDIIRKGALYRLICGPFSNKAEAMAAALKIRGASGIKPLIVRR
jgi:rare lipoprotein A